MLLVLLLCKFSEYSPTCTMYSFRISLNHFNNIDCEDILAPPCKEKNSMLSLPWKLFAFDTDESFDTSSACLLHLF